MIYKEQDLVMIRLETKYGYSNTWWRVMFVDNDETFIGRLEKHHCHEYEEYVIGQDVRWKVDKIKHVYKTGEQFCYSNNITICNCKGLCLDK